MACYRCMTPCVLTNLCCHIYHLSHTKDLDGTHMSQFYNMLYNLLILLTVGYPFFMGNCVADICGLSHLGSLFRLCWCVTLITCRANLSDVFLT